MINRPIPVCPWGFGFGFANNSLGTCDCEGQFFVSDSCHKVFKSQGCFMHSNTMRLSYNCWALRDWSCKLGQTGFMQAEWKWTYIICLKFIVRVSIAVIQRASTYRCSTYATKQRIFSWGSSQVIGLTIINNDILLGCQLSGLWDHLSRGWGEIDSELVTQVWTSKMQLL